MIRKTAYAAAAAAMLASTAYAEPVAWTLDLGHAYIGWEIDHMNMANTVGRFNERGGRGISDQLLSSGD